MVEVNRVKVKETFVPISIVLETKEEADAMYEHLNCGPGQSFHEYCVDQELPSSVEDTVKRLYDAFYSVHSV